MVPTEEVIRRTNAVAAETADALDDIVTGISQMLEKRLGDKAAANMATFKALEACIALHIWRHARQDAHPQIVNALTEMIREKLDVAVKMAGKINGLTPPDRRPN